MPELHEKYMRRCIDLARLGGRQTRTNPNVGAVLVSEGKIISEGYHKEFGGLHAERVALMRITDTVPENSILYISLEPCSTQGKTPACTDIIFEKRIRKVVISTLDPNPLMNGRSISILRSNGVTVETGILAREGKDLIKPFRAHLAKRPYVVLKFARSADGYIGKKGKQVWLSNKCSQVLSHSWRAESDGILVGYNTALTDNPSLTTRVVPGEHPVRIIIDHKLDLPRTLRVWSDAHRSIFVSHNKSTSTARKEAIAIPEGGNRLKQILGELFNRGICYLMVEGGAKTINWFVHNDLWDEARIIKSPVLLKTGITAPLIEGRLFKNEQIDTDRIDYIYRS